jgi:putative ABC transport system permease protein
MIPLAWKNILHNKIRTFLAISGLGFAIVMIFLQLGFYGAVKNTADSIFSKLTFDLILVSPNYEWIGSSKTFPRERLYQVSSLREVVGANSLYVERSKWRNPDTRFKRNLLVIGFNPKDQPFKTEKIYKQLEAVKKIDSVLIDRLSFPIIGPFDIGTITENENRKTQIGGQFDWGVGFAADGTAIVSDQNFLRIFPDASLDKISLGLISISKGIPLEDARNRLIDVLPSDIQVLTREEMIKVELGYWLDVTATGPIFAAGVVVAFIVGMVVLYQILSTEISNNLREYATLKAIGYPNGYFSWMVIQHGTWIALLGFVPAYGLSFLLYDLTRWATFLPIYMTPFRTFFVLGLSIMMCVSSAYLSLRKIKMADPAELF